MFDDDLSTGIDLGNLGNIDDFLRSACSDDATSSDHGSDQDAVSDGDAPSEKTEAQECRLENDLLPSSQCNNVARGQGWLLAAAWEGVFPLFTAVFTGNNRDAFNAAANYRELLLCSKAIATKLNDTYPEPEYGAWSYLKSASKAVADVYAETGTIPDEKWIDNIVSLVGFVSTEVPNWPRRQNPVMAYFEAIAPIIGAVERFAFNWPPNVLIADIAKRLDEIVHEQSDKFGGKDYELPLLVMFSRLFANCYYNEADHFFDISAVEQHDYTRAQWDSLEPQRMEQLKKLGGEDLIPLHSVWTAFYKLVDFVVVFGEHMKPPVSEVS